ncbi:FecR family protein [Sphingobacterium composti Ten et al. 2007 non Yoo et al. 2007]|uniref:FecR family protein n=1 Tax=Sphingobacterium composti TaxID=363260 RepID=UPI00135C00A8|nr:FecR family protein [Sphingobacterium composti Ten et al. 2007 non Yoo et al. 2007]
MNNESEILQLIIKRIDKTISDDELQRLEEWGRESIFNTEFLIRIEDESLVLEDVRLWLELRDQNLNWKNELAERSFKKIKSDSTIKNLGYQRYLNIAAVIVFFTLGFSFIAYKYLMTNQTMILSDLDPGTNKARIKLSDGRVIDLREDQNGVIFGKEINYTDGTAVSDIDTEKLIYAVFETPRGGKYNITLSDGTVVYLNAESKLKYPIVFRGKERMVELEGEAYFDVKKSSLNDDEKPFIVKTAKQTITVLGTQFNVNAYTNSYLNEQRTTLVEGKVFVENDKKHIVLKPGNQVIIKGGELISQKVDVKTYTSWVNDTFIFEDTELREVLNVLGRWYDFDYEVKNDSYNVQLYANISRKKNFKEVLDILSKSDIQFKLEKKQDKNKLIIIN